MTAATSKICYICHERETRTTPFADFAEAHKGHSFHEKCLRRWIHMHPDSPTCPLCRRIITHVNGVSLDQDKAYEKAAEEGDALAIQHLLSQGDVSRHQFTAAIALAAERNQVEMLRVLLTHQPITRDLRGRLVVIASQHGSKKVMQILLEQGPIKSHHYQQAMEEDTMTKQLQRMVRPIQEFWKALFPM
jgi:hypothetical protein